MNFQIYKPILIFLILEVFFGYLILNPPISNNAKLSLDMQKNIMRFFSIIMFVIIFYGFYPIIKDTFCYLNKGDKCVQQTKCIIKETTTTPIFFFAKKNIYCSNGQKFKVFFTFNSYFENEIFIFDYLLNSKVIINEKLIYSPYKKRLKKPSYKK